MEQEVYLELRMKQMMSLYHAVYLQQLKRTGATSTAKLHASEAVFAFAHKFSIEPEPEDANT